MDLPIPEQIPDHDDSSNDSIPQVQHQDQPQNIGLPFNPESQVDVIQQPQAGSSGPSSSVTSLSSLSSTSSFSSYLASGRPILQPQLPRHSQSAAEQTSQISSQQLQFYAQLEVQAVAGLPAQFSPPPPPPTPEDDGIVVIHEAPQGINLNVLTNGHSSLNSLSSHEQLTDDDSDESTDDDSDESIVLFDAQDYIGNQAQNIAPIPQDPVNVINGQVGANAGNLLQLNAGYLNNGSDESTCSAISHNIATPNGSSSVSLISEDVIEDQEIYVELGDDSINIINQILQDQELDVSNPNTSNDNEANNDQDETFELDVSNPNTSNDIEANNDQDETFEEFKVDQSPVSQFSTLSLQKSNEGDEKELVAGENLQDAGETLDQELEKDDKSLQPQHKSNKDEKEQMTGDNLQDAGDNLDKELEKDEQPPQRQRFFAPLLSALQKQSLQHKSNRDEKEQTTGDNLQDAGDNLDKELEKVEKPPQQQLQVLSSSQPRNLSQQRRSRSQPPLRSPKMRRLSRSRRSLN